MSAVEDAKRSPLASSPVLVQAAATPNVLTKQHRNTSIVFPSGQASAGARPSPVRQASPQLICPCADRSCG